MLKRILIVFIILVFIVSLAIIYINKVIMPTKIKSLIISGLEQATQKRVALDEVEFNLFKGLVLRNFALYDGAQEILSLKEGSAAFLILPIFKKSIIFTDIKLRSPAIFLKRRADKSFNIMDLFPQEATKKQETTEKQEATKKQNSGFKVLVNQISVINGRVIFQDETISPVFTKTIDNLSAKIFLSLPDSIRFNLKVVMASKPANAEILATGRFNLVKQQLSSQITLKNLSLAEFAAYYKGMKIPSGTVNATIDLEAKDNSLNAATKADILGIPVEAKVELADFKAPQVKLTLSSQGLNLNSDFFFQDKLLTITRCDGKYLNSSLYLKGKVDTGQNVADLTGGMEVDLSDIKERFKKQLVAVNPQGKVHIKFNLNGSTKDFKSCNLDLALSSDSLSFYGLKTQEFFLNCRQEEGFLKIPLAHLSLYGGSIDGSGAVNITVEHLPFQLSLQAKDIKIEQIKMDTSAKGKDISGNIQAQLLLNGFSNDPATIKGQGEIIISEGQLWDLNLFRGIGKMIFAEDFSHIVFSKAYCGFVVQDEYIFSDSLKFESSLVELSGSAKLGFDSSLNASLGIKLLNDVIPLKQNVKDLVNQVLGQIDALGVIKISGTLKEPKYSFQPAVIDIIKGLKDSIIGNIFKNKE